MNSWTLSSLQAHYKEKYENEVKGHYVGSYEDIYMLHCQKMEEMKSQVSNWFFFLSKVVISPAFVQRLYILSAFDKSVSISPHYICMSSYMSSNYLIMNFFNLCCSYSVHIVKTFSFSSPIIKQIMRTLRPDVSTLKLSRQSTKPWKKYRYAKT